MELLAKRAQIALAAQGRDLLKQKRAALREELAKSIDIALEESSELDRLAARAWRALGQAEAFDGPQAVESAGFAARRNVSIQVTGTNVMGVPVPEIERKRLVRAAFHRGYSLASTSGRIDAAASAFEEELELLIDVAVSEMRLRRLLEEIRKTSIRINSLEVIILPRLQAESAYIETVLDEREREDLFRLKRVKKALRTRS
jgi:V/A-type H+-transporting ATPase subunit D